MPVEIVVPERSANYLRREMHLLGGTPVDILSPELFPRNLMCSACSQEKHRSLFAPFRYAKRVICRTCYAVGKHCSRCGEYKPFSEFPKASNSGNRGGVAAYCKLCKRKRNAKEYALQGHTEQYIRRVRNSQLKYKFRISHEHYLSMFAAQCGLCAACRRAETRINEKTGRVYDLAVDHNHDTGEVRGLLCFGCNAAFGMLKEDRDRIEGLLEYAKKYDHS